MTKRKRDGTEARKYEEKLALDMPFEEALERFAGVEPDQMHANIAKSKKKKPPGGKEPSGDRVAKDQSVVQLRNHRKANHG